MGENEDFIVDKNGILLDYSPGTLHLDENGIVQDTDYSTLQLTGDYEDTQQLYDSQPYQSFSKNSKLDDQSWYCISDLEISDDEKDVQSSLGNYTPKSTYSRRPNAYKGQIENSKVTPGNQMIDYGYNGALNINYPIQPTYCPPNYKPSHELSQYIYDDKDPSKVFMNQSISSFQQNNNDGIVNYQTQASIGTVNTMYDYQKRDLLTVSESSSKSSLSIPEGLTASERDLYLQHANVSQILDSSHNESYQLEGGHPAQEEEEEEDDDELFLITGHIDFDSHQISRPGSANVLENSLGLNHIIRKESEGNCPKSRVAKRSVSFDLLPQEQSFNPNEEIPSFHGNVQEKNKPLPKLKRSPDQYCETSQCNPTFDQNNTERHSNQFQGISKEPNIFFNPDISLNSESNSANRNNQVRNELNSSYPQYFSDESFQVHENQEIPTFPKYSHGQPALEDGGKFQTHLNENQNMMNKSDNIGHDEIEEESYAKSKTDDSVKSFRAKSKSTTNIRSPSTPVKSKYKSLSELSNITDGDDEASNLKLSFSIKDLNAKLEEELSKRKKATEIVEQLQNRYDNLLTRYADAEMMIDELRIGSKMAPKISDFKSSQSPITNLKMNRALLTSTPMTSTYSMNQSTREDDDRMPLSGNLNLNNAERNAKTNEQINQERSKSAKIKADLIVQANHLESKMNTLVTLLEKRQLTSKEVKKVFDNIKNEQDKQRREYLRVKEEFQITGNNSEEVFDKDKELEGYLFQLQMRFDDLEDKHKHLQENQKEPFQETEELMKQTSVPHEEVEDSQVEDEAEKKREKFLSQYKSLMDRYHRLKISGSLNENDEEVKEIKKKLQVISEELCLNDHQQRLTMMSPDANTERVKDSPKIKNQGSAQSSGQNVSLREGIHKTNSMIGSSAQQKPTSSHPKKSGKKGNRIIRSLPAPPKESGEPANKKSDEVSSTTSVPDSGIFEELNGERHPSVTNKMRLASLRGQKVQSRGPVHTESSDGPATIDDSSPRVLVGPNRRRNSLGLAEVSSQSTGPASLNSQGHGDDSLLWQPAVTPLHDHYTSQGRSTESDPIDEYSSENSDQTDLDTSERPLLMRKSRPKSILRRKYKPSKIRPSSSERTDQKYERTKHKTSTEDSVSEHRERSRNSTSDLDKTERKKLRQRSLSLDPPKTKSSEPSPVIKSSNKEKLKNLQLEIESLKARFNNGIPWKNARVSSVVKTDTYPAENSSAGMNLPSYSNQPVFPSSPNVYHDNFPQPLQYQTTVRTSLEEVQWKDASLSNSHRSINNFIDSSDYSRISNSNAIITPSEPPTTYKVKQNQNTSVTLLDYHSPASQKKTFQRTPSQKSPVLSESEHRSNPLYLSNHNNNMQFLSPARSFQDCSQTQIDYNLHGSQPNQRQYCVLNKSSDYHRSTNSLAPEPVWVPHQDQFVFNPPHRNHSPYRVPLHSNTFQSQSSYSPVPNVVKRNPSLQFSRSCTPIPHSVTPICDICGIPGCSHNYVTEVNHTYPGQGGTHPVPAPPYSLYNSQNIPSQQRNHSNYRNYQSPDDDLNDSINIAERTIEDINHLTRKMMRTMHEELTKSKRNYDHFYPF